MNDWSLKIYREFCDELETVWKKLERSCQSSYIFQCYDWLFHWQKTIGFRYSIFPFIITVSHNNRVVALYPFALRNVMGAKIIEFLGGEQSDYNSPLIVDDHLNEENIRTIWHLVKDVLPAHDVITFFRLPQFLGKNKNYFCYICNAEEVSSSYALKLPGSNNELQSPIPKKICSDNRRQIRRLKKEGLLNFTISKSEKEFQKLTDSMILQKRDRCQNTGVRDILSEKAIRDFYKNFIIEKKSEIEIHLSAMMLNEKILSTHWGAIYKKRFYFLMPSYAFEWGRYSPGRLLLINLIEWSIKNGLKVFDFTVGSEDYKKNYCDKEMKMFELVKIVSIIGIPYFVMHSIICFLKRNPLCRRFITTIIANIRKIKTHLS